MKHVFDNGSINYEVRGNGKPLLILHGGYLDHRHMLNSLEPTFGSSSIWKRIYVDLPGHGYSVAEASIQSHDQLLDILLEFMESVCPNKTFAVAGESRGGFLARGLAEKKPDSIDGLLLIVPGRYVKANPLDLPQQVTIESAEDILHELNDDEIDRFRKLVVQNRSILEKIRRYKIPALKLTDISYQERVKEKYEFSFDIDDPEIVFAKPSLFLLGRNDIEVGYSDALKNIVKYPRATFVVLDKAGHSLAWEQPELFTVLVKDWLKRVEEYKK